MGPAQRASRRVVGAYLATLATPPPAKQQQIIKICQRVCAFVFLRVSDPLSAHAMPMNAVARLPEHRFRWGPP